MRFETHAKNSSLSFDFIHVLCNGIMIGGVFLDGWAHQHISSIESFFTPWHAVLYGGFFISACFLIREALLTYTKTQDIQMLLPRGYFLSFVGAGIFLIGGIGDMIWHIIFGIEVSTEALLSPTHLVLALGGLLIVTGPIRATLYRLHRRKTFIDRLPFYIALLYTMSIFAFFTQYAHPFVHPYASYLSTSFSTNRTQITPSINLGIASILLQTVFLMSFILLGICWDALLPGSITILLTLQMVMLSFMQDTYQFIPVVFFAGIVSDTLLYTLKPALNAPKNFALFAFFVPFTLYTFYFFELFLTTGIHWTIHLWVGSIFLSGIVGWLLSLFIVLSEPRKNS